MAKMLISIVLLALVGACAARAERQEQCTVQFPPGPCDSPSTPPRPK